jgi:hypothetical protein
MPTKIVVMIRGHLEGHLARCADSGVSTSMAEALEGDPCRRYAPPGCQGVCPRQSVEGGRHRVSSSVEKTLYLIAFSFFLQGAFC